jgi:hypothetical protein
MSSESTFVANVKTKKGTIVTVRGDDFDSFVGNISAAVAGNIDNVIGALEEQMLGTEAVAETNINYAARALGATVVESRDTFAPVPPPTQTTQSPSAPAAVCAHGPMVRRTAGKGPRAGKDFWACTAAQYAPDKCKPVNI